MQMGRQDFQVSKPHYISRYERPPLQTSPRCPRHCLHPHPPPPPPPALSPPHQPGRSEEVARLKRELLALLLDSREQL